MRIFKFNDYKDKKKVNTKIIGEGEVQEKVLPCKCHKVDSKGNVYTKIIQYSEKDKQGIQTKISNIWNKMKCTITKSGYYQVGIHRESIRVNRLIVEAFINNNNPKYNEVHHIDGDRLNNNVNNLEWGDAKSNAKDRELHGNTIRGSKSKNAKIDENMAIDIYNSNLSLQKTADKYNVSKKLVLLIKQKKVWKHIHDDKDDISEYIYGNKLVIGHGESGHRHVIENTGNVEIYKTLEEDCLLLRVLEKPATITHEEHKAIEIMPNKYRVRTIREQDHLNDIVRKVRD